MAKRLIAFMVLALLAAGCSGAGSELSVVAKVLKRELNASTSGGSDPGMSMPSSGSIFWVEGKVRNSGTEEAKHVSIAFRVTDGSTKIILTADIPSIASGNTVDFRTPIHASRTELRLIDEDPAITVGR